MTAAEKLKEIEAKIAELNIRITNASGVGGNHNFLSNRHPDTDPDSPVRGDIVRGIAGPEWQRYAIGAAGRFLRSDGNDPSWQVFGVGDLPAHKDTHDPQDGSDPLDCAAPSELVGVQAAAEGVAHEFARADHAHQIQHGVADNHLVTIDGLVAANTFAKFTANGLVARGYSQVLSDLSGQALAAFDWNAQNLTNVGTITSGAIYSAADTDAISEFGRGKIGTPAGAADDIAIAHYDHFSLTNYALFQSDAGSTFLNSPTGQALYFRINNVNVCTMSATYIIPKIDILTDQWLSSTKNTFIGASVCGGGNLAHAAGNEGWYNTGFGFSALYDITDGAYNDAFGGYALANVTEGSNNSALGYGALYGLTLGNRNVGVGYIAGYACTTGDYNVSVGFEAARQNILTDYNTAIGYQALRQNTAEGNTAVGGLAGYSNTGAYNIYIGYHAGQLQTAGTYNTIVGTTAGYGDAGAYNASYNAFFGTLVGTKIETGADGNTAFGCQSLEQITTGAGNIVLGYKAGDNITTGAQNIIIGYDLNAPSATANYQMNIGNFLHGKIDKHNLGLNTSTWGANADTVFAIKNGTPPAAAVADEIQIYSKDSSDGAANATLALMLEQAVEVIGTFTPSHKIKIWLNGTEYWLQLDAV